jgi:aconitase A
MATKNLILSHLIREIVSFSNCYKFSIHKRDKQLPEEEMQWKASKVVMQNFTSLQLIFCDWKIDSVNEVCNFASLRYFQMESGREMMFTYQRPPDSTQKNLKSH